MSNLLIHSYLYLYQELNHNKTKSNTKLLKNVNIRPIQLKNYYNMYKKIFNYNKLIDRIVKVTTKKIIIFVFKLIKMQNKII